MHAKQTCQHYNCDLVRDRGREGLARTGARSGQRVSTHPLGLSICGFALAICVVPRCRAPQLEESETFFSHWPGVLVRSSEICVRMNAPPSSLQKCHCRPGGGARAVLRADLSFRTTLAVRLIPSCEDLWRDLLVLHDGVYSNPVIVVNQKGAGEIVCSRVGSRDVAT
jgi:hypothetical protein